jgi:hypothetical protein
MIPYLPVNSSEDDMLKFYESIVDNLTTRSAHHEAWHTHKRDPSVCWICDLLEVSKNLIGEIGRYLSKSSLDIDDQSLDPEFSSEDDKVNYNVDDETLDELQSGGPT